MEGDVVEGTRNRHGTGAVELLAWSVVVLKRGEEVFLWR